MCRTSFDLLETNSGMEGNFSPTRHCSFSRAFKPLESFDRELRSTGLSLRISLSRLSLNVTCLFTILLSWSWFTTIYLSWTLLTPLTVSNGLTLTPLTASNV
jgi:hypothetical protein